MILVRQVNHLIFVIKLDFSCPGKNGVAHVFHAFEALLAFMGNCTDPQQFSNLGSYTRVLSAQYEGKDHQCLGYRQQLVCEMVWSGRNLNSGE